MKIDDVQHMVVPPTLPSVFGEIQKNVAAHTWTHTTPERLFPAPAAFAFLDSDAFLDPVVDRWLRDHTPTGTIAVLPPMLVLDTVLRAANAYLHEPINGLQSFELNNVLPLETAFALRCEMSFGGRKNDELHASIFAMSIEDTTRRTMFEHIGTAVMNIDAHNQERPVAMEALESVLPLDETTLSDERTHGPNYPSVVSMRRDKIGAHAVLSAAHCPMRDAVVHVAVLDAALQSIPHDRLTQWSDKLRKDAVGHVHKIIDFVRFSEPRLSQPIEVRADFAGFEKDILQFPMFDVQLLQNGAVLSAFRVIDKITHYTPLAELAPMGRRAFLRDHLYIGGSGLSHSDGSQTTLRIDEATNVDWPRGTVAYAYGLQSDDPFAEIAVRDHIARKAKTHPSLVEVSDDLHSGHAIGENAEVVFVEISRENDIIVVTDSKKRLSPEVSRRHRAPRSNSRHA